MSVLSQQHNTHLKIWCLHYHAAILLPCSAIMLWGWHITSPFLLKRFHGVLSLHQENREGQGGKKHDIKIQMPSSVAWIKIVLTSEVRRSPAGSGKSPPVNCCGLEWWMLVSTSEFQKNLSCRETGHLGTRLNNSRLCFLSSLVCLVLFLLPQISHCLNWGSERLNPCGKVLWHIIGVKGVRFHRDWVVL